MSSIHDILARNLHAIEQRVQAACARAGRKRQDVTLVAVTKTVDIDVALALVELGVVDLGENRPQELWRKAQRLPASVRWHLIGHLQRNKIDRTLPLVWRIHSVDSARLLAALDAVPSTRPVEVFLEFNCSGEASKGGFCPAEVGALVPVLHSLERLRVVGLMTMAAPEEDPEKCRPTFVQLRQLLAQLRREVGGNHPLDELSMGMSNDFEVAIEEGATSIRLGTVLLGGLPDRQEDEKA